MKSCFDMLRIRELETYRPCGEAQSSPHRRGRLCPTAAGKALPIPVSMESLKEQYKSKKNGCLVDLVEEKFFSFFFFVTKNSTGNMQSWVLLVSTGTSCGFWWALFFSFHGWTLASPWHVILDLNGLKPYVNGPSNLILLLWLVINIDLRDWARRKYEADCKGLRSSPN